MGLEPKCININLIKFLFCSCALARPRTIFLCRRCVVACSIFLTSLEKCLQNTAELGPLIKKHERRLHIYVIYCQNKPVSEHIVAEHLDYFEEIRVKLRHRLNVSHEKRNIFFQSYFDLIWFDSIQSNYYRLSFYLSLIKFSHPLQLIFIRFFFSFSLSLFSCSYVIFLLNQSKGLRNMNYYWKIFSSILNVLEWTMKSQVYWKPSMWWRYSSDIIWSTSMINARNFFLHFVNAFHFLWNYC